MNMGKRKIFAILMATIGCLIFNFNLKLAGDPSSDLVNGPSPDLINDPSSDLIKKQLIADPLLYYVTSDKIISQFNNLLTDVLSLRMTNIKGYSAGLFVHAVYGRISKGIVEESSEDNVNDMRTGCESSMYGFGLGVDNVWTFANEECFRLGTALGYMHGKTTPHFFSLPTVFPVTELIFMDYYHDVYAIRLFGAYESFDDKCLKTNIGVILGYNYSTNRGKSRERLTEKMIDEKILSHNISLGVEFIKNLYAHDGYQFGLWLQTNYNYVNHRLGNEADQHFNCDFLATVVGLNVEKEAFKRADKKLTLSLKTGWNRNCRLKKWIADDISYNPIENAAVVSLKASQKLNDHWSIDGSYSARFNKDFSAHGFAGGIEYAF